jgi:hypothetical protein
MLIDAEIDFVIRVPRSATFKAVDDFVSSGGDDYRILVDPPQGHPMRERGPVEVRALRISAPNGEESVLLTSLRQSESSKGEIGDLYHLRWQIKELYKVEKSNYLGQSQFHSKSPDGVRQEIYALTLFVAITRFLMAAAAREHQVSYEELSPKSGVLGLALEQANGAARGPRRRAPDGSADKPGTVLAAPMAPLAHRVVLRHGGFSGWEGRGEPGRPYPGIKTLAVRSAAGCRRGPGRRYVAKDSRRAGGRSAACLSG